VDASVAGTGARREHDECFGREAVEPLAGRHRLIGVGVVPEAAPVARFLDRLVGDGPLDDQNEGFELPAVSLEEPLDEVVRTTHRAALEVDQRPVLEGDIATSLDSDRLEGAGAAAISVVNTSAGFGGECHLDAVMVRAGMARLPLPDLDLLIIENVGNLVCPAEFRVGEHAKAMVFAVTEGEEKPLKYPVMFRAVDVVVVNKVDLLPHLDFDLELFLGNLNAVNPSAHVILASARTGEGMSEWCAWLEAWCLLVAKESAT
jgi:hydrogenase accessory protein HypB